MARLVKPERGRGVLGNLRHLTLNLRHLTLSLPSHLNFNLLLQCIYYSQRHQNYPFFLLGALRLFLDTLYNHRTSPSSTNRGPKQAYE